MNYFSRLTDIVTCNLSSLLEATPDQQQTLKQIIHEMEEGLVGAQRSVTTAAGNVERLESEIAEHRNLVEYWMGKARSLLADQNEQDARVALIRKRETEDLIAGLEPQLQSAITTRQQLHTTLRALEARMADARRRLAALSGDSEPVEAARSTSEVESLESNDRSSEIEDELERLKRELENS